MLPSVRELLTFSDHAPKRSRRSGSCDGSEYSASAGGSSRSTSSGPAEKESDDVEALISRQRPGRKVVANDRYTASNGARQYRCGVHSCAAVFKRPEHLKRHMLTHSQLRPFRCEAKNCGKRFSRRDNYITHLKKHSADFEHCDASSGPSTGCSTPTQPESPQTGSPQTVSNIFGLLNGTSEEPRLRVVAHHSSPSPCEQSGCSGAASADAATVASTPAPLLSLELLALASVQTEAPTQQPGKQSPHSAHVQLLPDASTSTETPCADPAQPSIHQTTAPAGSATGTTAIEQYSATVVTGDPAKPFMCTLCGSRFGRVEHVRRHHLVHTGQRKYECPVCLKSFARKDNMVQHLRAHERKDGLSS
ncbi:Vascular endothelial zinc finger 1 [Coemansia thaxteri]|uniref:Vascular endothelial zinc finger 1 n=1 Tax=Coemansia thaxteri TaxID=2663907 RepID=A0A9W8EDV6_9FUNG|nr:Vascular endothelial zinc finger 1 [Coemansia thaxteri]KAJ2001311.1 Vascular endothelial zinc finger 1 [Coemansia thaxteri]KAJ2469592.1 Vascular endothelial zinc finger 1 [Coemansia sp. RSA 2322]KAJ2484767.1 Vascular endothelial zinc finger 1 [Coemansia sp. RSA 2320]